MTGPVALAVWAPAARDVRVARPDAGEVAMTRDGEWWRAAPELAVGERYAFAVDGADGVTRLKSDPRARRAEPAPSPWSVVDPTQLADAAPYAWGDDEWLARRARLTDPARERWSVLEVHAGSWGLRRTPARRGYAEIADDLVAHARDHGFTHVEFLPLTHHPFVLSWGYQPTGWFAPMADWGTPDELRGLVDALHRAGIGVILDLVVAHFPGDDHGLARFDGTPLYEHSDPARAWHPDWQSWVFDLEKAGVRRFLLDAAEHWLDAFHVDALRVDAVASVLHRNYSRADGEWTPNARGGVADLAAVGFLRELNALVHHHPGAATIAEESTTWPGVTWPLGNGGLGFDFKWDMGWMNDTLAHHAAPARDGDADRHHALTFAMTYAASERFWLPVSHDEVVHEKGTLLTRPAEPDPAARFARTRALLASWWAHPGKQLIFAGQEFGDPHEFAPRVGAHWEVLTDGPDSPDAPAHRGLLALVAELNHLQATHPCLWRGDPDTWEGFGWIDPDDVERSVRSWWRRDPARPDDLVVCVVSTSPQTRSVAVDLPEAGRWQRLLDTEAPQWREACEDDEMTPPLVLAPGANPRLELTLAPHGAQWWRWCGA